MGGSTQQVQNTQSYTQQWAPVQLALQGVLGNAAAINPNLTGAESNSLQGLIGNSGFLNQFTPQATSLANTLATGGPSVAGTLNNAYQQYQNELNPYASGANLNPMSTPGFANALSTLNTDITSQINGEFAAAGRSGSGDNAQALARGLSQGEAGLLANQYNTNVTNQLNSAQNLFGAGAGTTGILSQLNQQALANQQAGLGAAATAADFSNSPYYQQLAAEAQQRGIPLQTLAAQMGLVLPAAQAFGSQQGNQTTSVQVPLGQQILGYGALGAGLFGKLLPWNQTQSK
jgi:hypothetical protein